jgi:hypothetical protein
LRAYEALFVDEMALVFAIGQDIEALLDQALEQLRTLTTAVKDDGHLPFANHYAHLAKQVGKGCDQGGVDVRTDHVFERGWLPDILPASAHDIHTRNNLDLNLSDGEFSFEPVDAAAFVSRVQPYTWTRQPVLPDARHHRSLP